MDVNKEIGLRIKQARQEARMTLDEVAQIVGIHKSTVARYEKGEINSIKMPVVESIANALRVNPEWVVCKSEVKDYDSLSKFPPPDITDDYTTFAVIGDIAAGYDHIAVEIWDGDKVDIPNSYLKGHSKEEFFVLRVKGDSMYPMYQEGDMVLMLRQTTVNRSGDVGAVIYDDEIATLKKIEFESGDDWMRLVPINPNIPPILIEGEKLEHCRVIGIPRLLIREI